MNNFKYTFTDSSAYFTGKIKLNIIYRVCDSVMTHAGCGRAFNLNKAQWIKKCIDTLAVNIKNLNAGKIDFKFYCVYDNCSSDILSYISETVRDAVFIESSPHGNTHSFLKCVEIAEQIPQDEICYFLEDDYLFLDDYALNKIAYGMVFLQQKNGQMCAIFPDDYPDRYRNGRKTADIIQTKCGNFMRIYHTTCTFVCFSDTVRLNLESFQKFRLFPQINENGCINLAWKNTPLYCPLDALTVHAQIVTVFPEYLDINKMRAYFES